jgi:hypothetical protein
MTDDIGRAVAELCARWRYTHPTEASFNHDQRLEDSFELMQLLKTHGIEVPMDWAMEAIPAPGAPVPVPCFEEPNAGFICSHHASRRGGAIDCWNLRNPHGEYVTP